jgi:hypothetical protein
MDLFWTQVGGITVYLELQAGRLSAFVKPYIALVQVRVEVSMAEMIGGHVVIGSAIAEQTDAVPGRRIKMRRI